MALGKIFVELGVNTGAFVEGLSKATYATKAFGKDVEHSFRNAAESISSVTVAFGAFGPAGAAASEVLLKMGESIGSVTQKFASLNPIAGVFLGATAGLAAGAIAAGAAAIGMAVHTAEANAQIYRSAQVAGVSTDALQRLGAAAKVEGLSLEVVQLAMVRGGRSAVQAAQSNNYAATAWGRLGIQVRDAHGSMKAMDELMYEVADKFSHMKDGPEKSAAAIGLFSRAGAQMIPLLNQGGATMKEFGDFAQRVGFVMGGEGLAAADRFHESMEKVEMITHGAQNRLSEGIVPALTQLVEAYAQASHGGNLFKEIGEKIGGVLKWVASLGMDFSTALHIMGNEFSKLYATMDYAWMVVKRFFAPSTWDARQAKSALESLHATVAELAKDNQKAIDQNLANHAALDSSLLHPGGMEGGTKDQKYNTDNEKLAAEKFREALDRALEKLKQLNNEAGKGSPQLKNFAKQLEETSLSQEIAAVKAAKGEEAKALAIKNHASPAEAEAAAEKARNANLDRATLKKLETLGLEANVRKVAAMATQDHDDKIKKLTDDIEAVTGKEGKETKGINEQAEAVAEYYDIQKKWLDLGLAKPLPEMPKLPDLSGGGKPGFNAKGQATFGQPGDIGFTGVGDPTKSISTMSKELKRVLAEMATEGQQFKIKFADTIKSGVDSATHSLAQFIVTGRGGFLQVLQQMEIAIVNQGLAWIFAKGAKLLYDSIFGAGEATKAVASNVARQAAIGDAGAAAAAGAAIGGPLAAAAAAIETISTLEGITSVGFAEKGAEAAPGQAFIVGEKRAELFIPRTAGTILPTVPTSSGGHEIHVHTEIHAVDAQHFGDLIEKHSKVVAQHVGRQLRLHNAAVGA